MLLFWTLCAGDYAASLQGGNPRQTCTSTGFELLPLSNEGLTVVRSLQQLRELGRGKFRPRMQVPGYGRLPFDEVDDTVRKCHKTHYAHN